MVAYAAPSATQRTRIASTNLTPLRDRHVFRGRLEHKSESCWLDAGVNSRGI